MTVLAEPDRAEDGTSVGTIDLPKSDMDDTDIRPELHAREVFQKTRCFGGCFDWDWIESSQKYEFYTCCGITL